VRFDVLWPPPGDEAADLNDTSIVLRVSYRDIAILLTGDIEAPAQEALLASGPLTAEVVKVPHHGSKTSATAFLQQTGATIAVISAGAGNPFGHPHAETLDALSGARVYRTDLHGRVVISTDGRSLRVETREAP
jgi:competence protein ComEC